MKLSINRNTIWCDLFVDRLVNLCVKYACISPGSRSTALTVAFASNKNVSVIPIVDERSSSFFALGLAKKSKTPVAIVTTSGTAVAELYPAIIEAYYQRIPLIICTADRPPVLRNSGANQTINQQNIFANHIRRFIDAGLPDLKRLDEIKKIADDAVRISCFADKGPVHINFPFEKPFEPKSYTDEIDVRTIEKFFSNSSKRFSASNCWGLPKESLRISIREKKLNFDSLAGRFRKAERGLIFVGFNNYDENFGKFLIDFSRTFGYPIYVDGAAKLRFGSHSQNYFIDNLTAIVRAKSFQKQFDPEIIIQFGSAPTANVLLEYFKNSKAEKFLVNDFGDRNDPSLTVKNIIAYNPGEFCKVVTGQVKKRTALKTNWLKSFLDVQKIAGRIKNKIIVRANFPFEGRIVTELISALPGRSNLMLSNSLPIRDIDFFASSCKKELNIFTNRGASGIDGINSTALGIAKASNEPTFLLTGDLAFYHDSNGLHSALKHGIPLTVILINNNGGGIFESLPISEYPEFFSANFLTPLELDFAKLVKAYDGNFVRIGNWSELRKQIGTSSKRNRLKVIEIRTDARKSKILRQKYWDAVAEKIDEFIDEIRR